MAQPRVPQHHPGAGQFSEAELPDSPPFDAGTADIPSGVPHPNPTKGSKPPPLGISDPPKINRLSRRARAVRQRAKSDASRRGLTGAARRSYVRSYLREMDHEAARHRSVAPVAVAAKQAEADYHNAFSVD